MANLTEVQKEASSAGKKALSVFLLAVVAAVMLGYMLAKIRNSGPDTRLVVVTTQKIAPGQTLRKEDLRETAYSTTAVPEGSFAHIDEVLIGDHISTTALTQAEPILKTRLTANRGLEVAQLIKPGMRAYVVEVSESTAYSQIINPNNVVDILVVLGGNRANEPLVARVVLQRTRVLAIGDRIELPSRTHTNNDVAGSDEGASVQLHHVVTLLLSLEDIEKIVLAKNQGKLELALRNDKDNEIVNIKPLTLEHLGDKSRTNNANSIDPVVTPTVSPPPPPARPRRGHSAKKSNYRQGW